MDAIEALEMAKTLIKAGMYDNSDNFFREGVNTATRLAIHSIDSVIEHLKSQEKE